MLPFERCAIALDQRGRLQLKAVSGMATIPVGESRSSTCARCSPGFPSYDPSSSASMTKNRKPLTPSARKFG